MATRVERHTQRSRTSELAGRVRELLEDQADVVPFHSWTHTDFVRNKAVEFARERRANEALVEVAALVHDLNYVVVSNSAPSAARNFRAQLLADCGFAQDEISQVEEIIEAAHTESRRARVDVETACLSDADTLYKALPITPVLFSHRYLAENDIKLGDLAVKIVSEQLQKLSNGYYFYDPSLARRYRGWAEANLGLWSAILDSLSDPDVARLVERETTIGMTGTDRSSAAFKSFAG